MSIRPVLSGAKSLLHIKDALVTAYRSNPRLANACTGCLTFSLGDVLAQKIEQRKAGSASQFDVWRSIQIGLLGLVMNGFFLHHWYHGLDRIVGSSMTSKIGVATKVAADQLIYAPFAIVTFFGFNSIREAQSVTELAPSFMGKMHQSFVSTFLADCVLWPASNFINFRYINLAYRPSFTAVVQLLWQTYLSFTSSRALPEATGMAGAQSAHAGDVSHSGDDMF